MAGQLSELDRLQLQSRVWEPAGARLLDEVGSGSGLRVVDVGCGCLGWLRVLSEWVGPAGEVVGTDIDLDLLAAAGQFIADAGLSNVRLVQDDLFDSTLDAASFDLVHARFQLAPLGRADEQLQSYRRLLADGGTIVVEDPDSASWRFNPSAPALEQLIDLIRAVFLGSGGDLDAGRHEPELFRRLGLDPVVRADILALPAGHPYLALPLQFATSLRPRLTEFVSDQDLDALVERARAELDATSRWGTTFTLIQTCAIVHA